MPDLKDFFNNLNFVSECCNGGNTIIDDGDDYEIFRRIAKLEGDYDQCVKHQAEVRATIAKLVHNLEDNSKRGEKEPLLKNEAAE